MSEILVVAAVDAERMDLPGVALGVGPVVAGIAAGRVLAECRPKAVLMLGTVGAFPGGPPIGAIGCADVLGFADPLGATGLGYIPMAPAPLRADPRLAEATGRRRLRVLTSLGVTTHEGLAEMYGTSWEVEHMEAYAVALACAEAGVLFAAILGVTNRVGPQAHGEWLRNREAVQAAVVEEARRCGGALAECLVGR